MLGGRSKRRGDSLFIGKGGAGFLVYVFLIFPFRCCILGECEEVIFLEVIDIGQIINSFFLEKGDGLSFYFLLLSLARRSQYREEGCRVLDSSPGDLWFKRLS